MKIYGLFNVYSIVKCDRTTVYKWYLSKKSTIDNGGPINIDAYRYRIQFRFKVSKNDNIQIGDKGSCEKYYYNKNDVFNNLSLFGGHITIWYK